MGLGCAGLALAGRCRIVVGHRIEVVPSGVVPLGVVPLGVVPWEVVRSSGVVPLRVVRSLVVVRSLEACCFVALVAFRSLEVGPLVLGLQIVAVHQTGVARRSEADRSLVADRPLVVYFAEACCFVAFVAFHSSEVVRSFEVGQMELDRRTEVDRPWDPLEVDYSLVADCSLAAGCSLEAGRPMVHQLGAYHSSAHYFAAYHLAKSLVVAYCLAAYYYCSSPFSAFDQEVADLRTDSAAVLRSRPVGRGVLQVGRSYL